MAGNILPVTVYDQHGFRVLFHFAKDSLPDRPDVLVVVISMLSTAPLPIKSIVFQSAVPKVMSSWWENIMTFSSLLFPLCKYLCSHWPGKILSSEQIAKAALRRKMAGQLPLLEIDCQHPHSCPQALQLLLPHAFYDV